MSQIKLKEELESTIGNPPAGQQTFFIDLADGHYKKKMPDGTVIDFESAANYTDEKAQDAIGAILEDTASVKFTYNDGIPEISAIVLASGVDHDSLLNFVSDKHVPHSSVSIAAGNGLTGGGDISASRTISMPDVGVSGAYGSQSVVPVITTDAQGRVSSVTNTPIQIIPSSVSGFDEAAQDAVASSLTDSSSVAFSYNDISNEISASVLASGVNHNTLQNYLANEHVNHSAVSILAGPGLTGGGDLTSSRTLELPTMGASGVYGSSGTIPVIQLDAYGRVLAASSEAIGAQTIQSISGISEQYGFIKESDSLLQALSKLQYTQSIQKYLVTQDVTIEDGETWIRDRTKLVGTTKVTLKGSAKMKLI